MLRYSPKQIAEMLDSFIWTFRVGDNISYNLRILFKLYEDKDRSSDKRIYNKLIIIEIVSIIESLMYDLVLRLDQATNHFPATISKERQDEIDKKLHSEKVIKEVYILNQRMRVQKVSNYSMDKMIKLFEEFQLFGHSRSGVYTRLQTAARLRNRIHIFNWWNNFEEKEWNTFSDSKLEEIEKLLNGVLSYMSRIYPRPKPGGNS